MVCRAHFGEMVAEGIWIPSPSGEHYVLSSTEMPSELLQLPALATLFFFFLPKDKCNLHFFSWKMGDLVEEKETSLEILVLMLCNVQSIDVLDCPLLKSLFRPTTREKINFKRSGVIIEKRNNGVVCDQEGRENQITYIQLEIMIA